MKIATAFLTCVICTTFCFAEPQQTTLFSSGTDGYNTYRIPAMLVTKSNTILAFICENQPLPAF